MKNIHAYTELDAPVPAYVSLNDRPDIAAVELAVRSRGGQSTSSIILSNSQLRRLADDIYSFLESR